MKINKRNLLNALEAVKPGLANKEVIEQSTSFAFLDGYVATYNDVVHLKSPVEELKGFNGTIPAEELYRLLQRVSGEFINIEHQDNEIIITADKAKAGLVLQEEIKLPLQEVPEPETWTKIDKEEFEKALNFVIKTTSQLSHEAILNCVHFNPRGFVESSDNHRIARFTFQRTTIPNMFLLIAGSVKEALKISPTEMAVGVGWVHFRNDKVQLSCRTYPGEFPNTDAFISVQGKSFKFPDNIDSIIDRAAVFASSTTNDNSKASITKIQLQNNTITLSSRNEVGWFEESERVRWPDEPITFHMDGDLLKDVLKKSRDCEYAGNLLRFAGDNWVYLTTVLK